VAESVSVLLESIPPGSEIADTLTGLSVHFPDGASGWLTTGTLASAPPREWEGGSGFYLSYEGSEPCQVRIPHAPGGYEFLLCYGVPYGGPSEGPAERWFAMPVVDTLTIDEEDWLLFWLSMPPAEGSSCVGGCYYWQIEFPPRSELAASFAQAIATVRGFLGIWSDSLAEAFNTVAGARTPQELPPTFYPDGDYYSGFLRICAGEDLEVEPAARIGLAPSASEAAIAHQVGHYLTHLLVGDDAYFELEERMPTEAGIGAFRDGRRGLPEDYAYYFEYLLTGKITGAGDPSAPAEFFPEGLPAFPAEVDLPSLEGYGVLLMHALTRRDSTMVNLLGDVVTVPIAGLTTTELVAEILSHGAYDMDGFLGVAETYLESIGKAGCLPALAAATGWAYSGWGQVVGRTWGPIAGAEIVSVTEIDGREFYASSPPAVSDSLGWFLIPALFPGTHSLRVRADGDSLDFELYAPWLMDTDNGVWISKLFLWPDLSTLNKITITLGLDFALASEDSTSDASFDVTGTLSCDGDAIFGENHFHTEVPVSFVVGHPDKDWVLDTLSVVYSLDSGDVSEFILRASSYSPEEHSFSMGLAGPLRAEVVGSKLMFFGNLPGVPPDQVQGLFDISMTGPEGHEYSQADLVGNGQTVVVKVHRA
jgi:hypothetical protein